MNIFLTGSTGFLGGKLIRSLIDDSQNELYVLVRDIEKANKLKSTFDELEQQRIHLIKGDITLPNCGLSDDDIFGISDKIDVFYHLAALVKFDEELREELFEINYKGTQHALDLAININTHKFYYVSTAYTVGKSNHGAEDLYPYDHSCNNPYEDSKIKSEHLVFSYKDKLNVSIFRPAIIVGDSQTGEADSQFTLYGFMRALEVFKRRVSRKKENTDKTYHLVGSSEGTSNFVPVDYVTDILSLAATKAKKDTIYHITNPNPPTNLAILNELKDSLQFENLSIVPNHIDYTLTSEELSLNEMINVFNPYLSRIINFEDANTQLLINDSHIQHLNMTPEMLRIIIHAYFKNK